MRQEIAFGLMAVLFLAIVASVWLRVRRARRSDKPLRIDLSSKRER